MKTIRKWVGVSVGLGLIALFVMGFAPDSSNFNNTQFIVTGTTLSIAHLSAALVDSGTIGTAQLGSGAANNTKFLRGDQTWATPTATPSGAAGGVLGGTYPNPSFGTFSSATFGAALTDPDGTGGVVLSNAPTLNNATLNGSTSVSSATVAAANISNAVFQVTQIWTNPANGNWSYLAITSTNTMMVNIGTNGGGGYLTNLFHLGNGVTSNEFRFFNAAGQQVIGVQTNGAIQIGTNNQVAIDASGNITLQGGVIKTPSTSTAVGMLGLDSGGNIVSNAVPSGSGGSNLDPLNTANSILVEEFPNPNLANNQIGALGWSRFLLGAGGVSAQAGAANHPGIIMMSTGTTSGDGSVLSLFGATNSTVSLYPPLNASAGWTNTFIFKLNSTNDCIMWMGLVNNLVYISTEPADWMGLSVSSGTANTWIYNSRASSTSTTQAGPALDNNSSTAWHKFQIYSLASGTIIMSLDGANAWTNAVNVTSLTLSPMVVLKKSASANSVTLNMDYWSGVLTGMSR